jgi:hypothetical protein
LATGVSPLGYLRPEISHHSTTTCQKLSLFITFYHCQNEGRGVTVGKSYTNLSEDNHININRGKLCAGAIALLTTTLSLVPNLAEAKSQALTISRDYVGDACIVLGSVDIGTEVTVYWGAFRGTRYVDANRGAGEIYGVNIYAKGNNVENLTVEVHDKLHPYLVESRCQDIGIPVPFYLDWRPF